MDQIVGTLADHGDLFGVGFLLVGTLTVIFRAIATGALVFRRQLDDLRASTDAEIQRTIMYYDKVIALKDQQVESWHNAFQNEAIARTDQGATLAELAELSRAADHMLKALPTSRAGGALTGGGDKDV